MITVCKSFLTDSLVAAGIPRKRVYRELEALGRRKLLPMAVLVIDREELQRDGSRVACEDLADGKTRVYRRRLFKRTLPVKLVLVHRDETRADAVLQAVLREACRGFSDSEGNHHRATVGPVTWWDDESVTRRRATVEVTMEFHGGVYMDAEVPRITDVAPEPEDGQEE